MVADPFESSAARYHHFPCHLIGQAGYARLLTRAGVQPVAWFGSCTGEECGRTGSHHLIVAAHTPEGTGE